MARAEEYYGAPFRGEIGFTQGNPLSPTIFNVVVEAVVCHWESVLVMEREGGESSNNKVDRTQMAGRKIWDRDDESQWVEEGHQRLMVKTEFFMPTMGRSLPRTQDGSSWC